MLDILNIGDNCRDTRDRPARHIGRGVALVVIGSHLDLAPAAPARGGEALHPLPSDAEVAQWAVRLPWGL
jgi:hypothetical protein